LAALGIDPAGEYQDATGRPYPISLGRPLFGSVLESRR
jgi:hypothetical protein